MEIKAKREQSGVFQLDMGPVIFSLPVEAIEALQKVVYERLNQPSQQDDEAIHRKIKAYRALASKMTTMDNRVVEKFLQHIEPEHLITLVRLAEGDELYSTVKKNLSKQNRRQFEEDYLALDKITEHCACVHMEQLIPHIKRAVKEQKELMEKK